MRLYRGTLETMADVSNDVQTQSAADERQKRAFGDITNAGTTTTGPSKKPTPEPPKKQQYVGGWTEKDRASSKPHSDATKGSEVLRRTYGLRLVLQDNHAPQIAEDVTYYDHVEPNAVKALKARKSGEGVTVVLTAEQPLQWPPIDGGVSNAMNVPETSSDVVGVNEGLSAGSKKANEVIARKKQAQKGKGAAGVTRAPSFSVWFGDELVGKYEGDMKKAPPDIKQKRPGEYMTWQLLSCLLGKNKKKLLKSPSTKKAYEDTDFTAEYDV